MPVIAASLIAKVGVEGDVEAKAKLDSVNKKVDDTSKGFRDKLGNDLKLGMAVGAASVVALGVAATKMAGDYNAGLTTLVTGAGEAAKNLKMIHDGELQMSVDVGTSVTQLTSGMYMIESAGFHGAKGLDVLKAAAEGAKVGNADLGVVANGVTTIMVDYANQNISAAQATNTLVATVAAGKTTMTELAPAMASVLPTAAAVHAKLTDVAAAMATMTAEGTPAADAATYLRQMLLALEVPGSKAVKTFKEIGLSTTDVTTAMQKSLPGALQLIEDHLSKKFPVGSADYVAAMKDMAGGQKNFQAWLELTGQHLDVFKQDVQAVGTSVKDGGTKITGWTEVQKDFNYQLDVAHQAFDAVLIKVGEQLMPMLSTFLHDVVMPAITNFQDWATHTNTLHDAFQTVVTVASTLIGDVQTLASGAVNLFQAFQQGQPWVDALAIGIGSVGTAIGLIKIEEFAAGLFNASQTVNGFRGAVANLADGALPNLGKALGWAKTNAQETAAAVESIGPAAAVAETEVSFASAGMTLALGVATAGISILVGAIAAGVMADAMQVHDATAQMSQDTKNAYDSLGTSAQDVSAKNKAAAAETDSSWTATANDSTSRWQNTGEKMKKASNDAKAQMILDQQAVADAAEAAAQRADDAWVRASQAGDLAALYKASGYTNAQIKKLIGSTVDPTVAAPVTGAHATGILNNPVGHYAKLAEAGGEWMHIPTPTTGYVPAGASVFPHGVNPGSFGGGSNGGGSQQQPAPVYLQIDGQTVARMLMPHNAALLRSGLGVVGI